MDQATTKETWIPSKNYNQSIKNVSPHDYCITDGGGSSQMITVLHREYIRNIISLDKKFRCFHLVRSHF